MKKKLFIAIGLIFNLLLFSQNEQNNKPKVNVVGIGTVSAFPNAAEITIAFNHIKPTLREAINENQKTTSDVLAIIKKYVEDASLIKTSLISTNKATKWDNKLNREIFVGFESSQKVIFTLKDLNKMQDFTEELLKTKFNKIERISYFNTSASEFLIQAQELAVKDAIENTKRIANTSGINIGKIIYIHTNTSPNKNSGDTVEAYEFETFNKGMGGRGVSSSGELIKYTTSVTVYTEIIN